LRIAELNTSSSLSIQAIFWQLLVVDLHVTYTQLTRAMSVNFVGLAMGCVFFIPLARKFGRRPVYLISTALMLVTSFWSGEITTLRELYVTNLLQGLAGATNESIVQMTVRIILSVRYAVSTKYTNDRLQICSLCTIVEE
jgi:MFS family permease